MVNVSKVPLLVYVYLTVLWHLGCLVSKDTEVDASVQLLSRPEHMLIKCTSFSSVESDLSEGSRNGLHSRAGTMSEGNFHRRERIRNDRPKSEIPISGLHKELEASFEVSWVCSEVDDYIIRICTYVRMYVHMIRVVVHGHLLHGSCPSSFKPTNEVIGQI